MKHEQEFLIEDFQGRATRPHKAFLSGGANVPVGKDWLASARWVVKQAGQIYADIKAASKKKDWRTFSIIWAKFDQLFVVGNRESIANHFVGVCGFRSQVFRVESPGNALAVMIMQNVIVTFDDNGQPLDCEEAEGCLCFECPLNRTTWESYKRRVGVKGKRPPTFGQTLDCNLTLDGSPQFLKDLIDKYGSSDGLVDSAQGTILSIEGEPAL